MTQPLRALFFLLVLLGVDLMFHQPTRSAPPPGEATATEPLFYTVQIGSYGNEEEAQAAYSRLDEQLPAELKPFLRIELISPFHTVRVGKAESRQEIIRLFTETQRINNKPSAIIHGYFRQARIVKLYGSPTPPGNPAAPPLTTPKKSPPTTAVQGKVSGNKAKDVAKSSSPPATPEEPLDTPLGMASATKHLPPRPADKKAPSPIKPAASLQIPDATLKKMIIDKYLANQSTAKSDKEAIIKQRQSYPESPTCVSATCHATIKTDKNGHYPVQAGRCLACHQQVNPKHPDATGADFKLVAQTGELCNKCHPKLHGKKYAHDPAAKGECLKCHTPHGGGNPFLLNVDADNQDKLCLTCHDKTITTKKFTHGPVGLGACTFCHDPHESDKPTLLKNDPQALCFECHTDIAKGVKESKSIHQVVQTEGCVTCHLPHGSEFPFLLKQGGEDLCFTCHPGIKEKIDKSRSKHAGLYLDKQCGTCHQPHFSQFENLLSDKELDLCLGCHSEKNTIRSKTPKNIAIELKKTFVHEPLAKGQCAGCHDPHGSKFLKLLSGPYPDTFYAPYEPDLYDLCFTCHDKELLTSQTTESSTSFRNGAQNLHYLHAAIPRKGRTCRTCHQSHSSDGPKLINQTGSSFGEWQMSISFATTGNGGNCMPGCHRKMEYNRDKAVNNSITETEFGEYHVEYESVK
jgi:predicted CXXCH cytochrome family protein